MAARLAYTLIYAPEVVDHLRAIDRKHHSAIRDAIETQLCHTPLAATRNRKPLDAPSPFEATWEVRCGPGNRFRVFYEVLEKDFDIESETSGKVVILAVGHKSGNRLRFAGEEFEP